jgi:hypothetical protein
MSKNKLNSVVCYKQTFISFVFNKISQGYLLHLYIEFFKHFPVTEILSKWTYLWTCMNIHSEVNITLMSGEIKGFNQTYESCTTKLTLQSQ